MHSCRKVFFFLSLLGELLIFFVLLSEVTLKAAYGDTAPTLNLSASPGTITQGQSSSLQWSATGATSCTASVGWSGPQPVQGAITTSPASTKTYTLACSGPEGKVEASVTVTVLSLTFSASPGSITQGQSSSLQWSATGATSCTASGGWSGPKRYDTVFSLPLSEAVHPTSTTTYTLTCWSRGGSVAKSVTVTVHQPRPPRLHLSASPGSITQGQSSSLQWSATGATSCTASGGWSGPKRYDTVTPFPFAEAVHPTSTTTYTLACSGPGGSVEKSVTVTVELSPVPKALLPRKEADRPSSLSIPGQQLLK